MRTLSIVDARRLAVMGQLLSDPAPMTFEAVAKRLGRIQIDPTVLVDRAERLTFYSRLGPFDREALRALSEAPPLRLFEYEAHLIPVDDLPLHRPAMRRFPDTRYTRGRYIESWLRDNADFRTYVLSALRERGPLRSSDLEDRAAVPWRTGGWNDGKSLSPMLEILCWAGDIAIARRDGAIRWWDLFERVLPVDDDHPLPDDEVEATLAERRLLQRGLVKPAKDDPSLRSDVAVPVRVEGLPGGWLAHAELLAQLDGGGWAPRTAILGPFDPLIHDRRRAQTLFAFDYAFELYVPAAKRRYGPYTLAVLHGDRFVARFDANHDRRAHVLTVNRVWLEPDAPPDTADLIRPHVAELATWLGAALSIDGGVG